MRGLGRGVSSPDPLHLVSWREAEDDKARIFKEGRGGGKWQLCKTELSKFVNADLRCSLIYIFLRDK